jgi:nicotinamidase/pyrazinamidase
MSRPAHSVVLDPETDILGAVDVQPTFMPGGELPVAEGEAVVAPINRLLAGPFRHAFATQDWHPPGHVSFASAHGQPPFSEIDLPYGRQTLWPDHALQGSANAALHPALAQARIEVVVRKGFHAHTDSYSAFFENDRTTVTGLDGWLRARGFRRLFLCGLATDFCVAWSAADAVRLGYHTYVIEDASRGIGLPAGEGQTTMDGARVRLAALGVRFVREEDFG